MEGDPSQGKDKEVSSEAGGFEHRELNEVSKIVDHKGMWDHYHGCLTRARRGLTVSNGDLKQCTAAVLIMMTYLAWQRPGATANLTIDFLTPGLVTTHLGVVTMLVTYFRFLTSNYLGCPMTFRCRAHFHP